jgi:hypothetical protein
LSAQQVASLSVVGVLPNGERLPIAAAIGQPYAHPQGGWACPVEVAPIYPKLADIRGVDSFHATWLACSLILKLLAHFKAEGGALLCEDGSQFPLEEYQSGLDGGKQ